jgi:hypothetical protein
VRSAAPHRLYDWACLELADLDAEEVGCPEPGTWTRGLLVRRSLSDASLAYFTTWCPTGTALAVLVGVEGRRWAIEDAFETAKTELGLDHNETRSWHGWHRHVSLVMLAFALLAAAVGSQLVLERVAPEPTELLPTLWMRSPAALDRVSLQFDDVAADLYWIRSVVYYGGVRRSVGTVKNYDLLYPLLDITTTLDPRFLLAYRMGAIFLSEPYPGGAGRPDLAIALLKKGITYDPKKWQLVHDLAFVHFWANRDYVAAAEWLDRASKIPGAPSWLKTTAGGLLTRAGQRDTARGLWSEMLKSDVASMRDIARLRLTQLDAMDHIDAIHSLIARVTLATGIPPRSWRDLIARGYLRDVPLDPSGYPYEMDPNTARVDVSASSALYPMPDDLDWTKPQ